jgi:hypothetical protein
VAGGNDQGGGKNGGRHGAWQWMNFLTLNLCQCRKGFFRDISKSEARVMDPRLTYFWLKWVAYFTRPDNETNTMVAMLQPCKTNPVKPSGTLS